MQEMPAGVREHYRTALAQSTNPAHRKTEAGGLVPASSAVRGRHRRRDQRLQS